jgi:hypothetical protein
LKEKHLSVIQAYGDATAKDPDRKGLSGLEFTFTDGSIETVGTKGDHVPSSTVNMLVEIKEEEAITDIMLHFAPSIQGVKTPMRLCGVQVSSNAMKTYWPWH